MDAVGRAVGLLTLAEGQGEGWNGEGYGKLEKLNQDSGVTTAWSVSVVSSFGTHTFDSYSHSSTLCGAAVYFHYSSTEKLLSECSVLVEFMTTWAVKGEVGGGAFMARCSEQLTKYNVVV